jgi:hypothetical protein
MNKLNDLINERNEIGKLFKMPYINNNDKINNGDYGYIVDLININRNNSNNDKFEVAIEELIRTSLGIRIVEDSNIAMQIIELISAPPPTTTTSSAKNLNTSTSIDRSTDIRVWSLDRLGIALTMYLS